MKILFRTPLVALGLAVAMTGGVRNAYTLDEPAVTASSAALAPLLEDALNRVLPELHGPGLPRLIVTVRELAAALESPDRALRSRAAERARKALARFEAGLGGYFATDLDVIRLAIGAAGSFE